jgi:hypothetical protein
MYFPGEFVCAMWNFLGMDPSFLGAFAFYIFDEDGTNALEYKEVKNIVETVHHKTEENPGIRKLIESIMSHGSSISIEYFTKCCRENPSLTAPLISLQHELRAKLVGVSFWVELAQRRGLDPEQGKPSYIQTLSKRIMEKRRVRRIEEIQSRRSEAATSKLEQKRKGDGRGRRRSSIVYHYFVKDEDQPKEHKEREQKLPAAPRARRSSILAPSLTVSNIKKKKAPASSQVHPNGFSDLDNIQRQSKEAPPISQNSEFVDDRVTAHSTPVPKEKKKISTKQSGDLQSAGSPAPSSSAKKKITSKPSGGESSGSKKRT